MPREKHLHYALLLIYSIVLCLIPIELSAQSKEIYEMDGVSMVQIESEQDPAKKIQLHIQRASLTSHIPEGNVAFL